MPLHQLRPRRHGTADGLVAALVCAAGSALACTTPPSAAKEARMSSRPTPWTLTYADGSANRTVVAQRAAGGPVELEYDPVTPAESSTGHYSGGEPVERVLRPDDPAIEELWRRVAALEDATALHVEDRAKGTGWFSIAGRDGARSFIVRASPALTDFDAHLRALRASAPRE